MQKAEEEPLVGIVGLGYGVEYCIGDSVGGQSYVFIELLYHGLCLGRGDGVEEFCFDGAGVDGCCADVGAFGDGFCTEGFQDCPDEMLCAAVDSVAGNCLDACHGGCDDDVSFLLSLEFRKDGSHGIEYAFDVDIYHIHPVLYLQVRHITAGHDAGIGEEDVHFSEVIFRQGHRCIHIICVSYVGLHPDRVFSNLSGQFFQSVFPTRAEDYLCAVCRRDKTAPLWRKSENA